MAMPETDFEYVLHGKPQDVCSRLESLGFLSTNGLNKKYELKMIVTSVQSRYEPPKTGPSYVHELASRLLALKMISEAGVLFHNKGTRPHFDRWQDKEFMQLVGEEERYKQFTKAAKKYLPKHRPWWKFWK